MTDKPYELPAFPTEFTSGMTLRDYFAGQALAGTLCARPTGSVSKPDQDANWAYLLADAMLKARETGE